MPPGEKEAHEHKLFALVNVQMALGQTAGCPRVNRANGVPDVLVQRRKLTVVRVGLSWFVFVFP